MRIGNGYVHFLHHYQPYPKFKWYWRWKTYKATFETGPILFGHWFTILLDFDWLGSKEYKQELKKPL